MRNKKNVINTIPPTTDYPMGRIKDDTGVNDGTPIVEQNNGDIQETVTFFMEKAKIVPNELPDNKTNGYQIAEAMQEVAGKFNKIHDARIVNNVFIVNFRLDNVEEKDFLISKFTSNENTQSVLEISKIMDSEGHEYNVFLTPDYAGNFFNDGRYIVEKQNDYFLVYPVAARSILSNIYDRLDSLEINTADILQVIDRGTYIQSSFAPSGTAIISHKVLDINSSKIIITCSRKGTNPTTISPGTFSYLITERNTGRFLVAFDNFPVLDTNDGIKIDWWIVKN